jgi:hypothetical protein
VIDGKFIAKGWVQEVPTGTVNGSNTAFTLSTAPREPDVVQVYLNGIRQRKTTDYSISGTTITFVSAPVTDQSVYVEYFQNTGGS